MDAISRWLVETSGLGPRSLAAWVKAGTGPRHASAYVCLWKNFVVCFPVLCARAVRTWNLVHYFPCPSGCYVRASGIAEEYGNLDFSGDVYFRWCNALYNSGYMFFGCFGRICTFSTWRRTRFLKGCFSIRFEGRSVPVDASVAVWLCAVRILKRWKFFSRVSRV